MELPPELTRIPTVSLDVLRTMGQSNTNSGTMDDLANLTGMSERGIGKAIRGLVTKGYLDMDNTQTYYLTDKGKKAIEDVRAFDASGGGNRRSSASLAQQELVAVAPASVAPQNAATVQIGFNGAVNAAESQLVLRLSAVGGQVSPSQLSFDIQAGKQFPPGKVQVTPSGEYGAVRVRVEAMQLIGDTDVHAAGGMFFDVPVGQSDPLLRAWMTSLGLQS